MMGSSKPAASPAPGHLPASLTLAAMQPMSASFTSSRREGNSNTWTSSGADMTLLSDTNDVEDRACFVEAYNRLAGKFGIRSIVLEDFEDASSVATIAPPGKKKWFSRRHDSGIGRTISGKPDKSLCPRASIGDFHLYLGGQGRRDSLRDKSLQTLVRLCGKSFLYLPAEYTPGCLVIPTCLRAMGQYLVQNGPQEKGLFRVPGSTRAVNALYDYYCADNDESGIISGTVRTPNLPAHLEFGVHDVASTFKRLLAGLPGGILGSLSVFDALVAIRGQLDGGLEKARTRQTRLRARLIALAIATLSSHYQRELVCAVFGLLCLVGRAAEMAPREDEYGRPLPTSDLMGYKALGIIFGPLLVGGLIDRWSTNVAIPSASPMHLHPTQNPPRKEDGKRRAVSGGRRPATPVTVDKILIANSIAEMVIENWREVVRHLKDTNSIHNNAGLVLPTPSSIRHLRASASESALCALSRQNRKEDSAVSHDEASVDGLTVKSQRMGSRSGRVPFTRRTSPRLSPNIKEAVADRSTLANLAAVAEKGDKIQEDCLSMQEFSAHPGGHTLTTSTPSMSLRDLLLEAAATEPRQMLGFPGLSSGDSSFSTRRRTEQIQQLEEAHDLDNISTSAGILAKAHRALKAKLTNAAQRGSRSMTPHSSGTGSKKESSCSGEETFPKEPVLKELVQNTEPLPHQSSSSTTRSFVTTMRRSARRSEGITSSNVTGNAKSRSGLQSCSTGVVQTIARAGTDQSISRSMVRKNALRQQQHPRQSIGAIRVSAKANADEEVPKMQSPAQQSGEEHEEKDGLSHKPHFHIEEQNVTALRERGSPARVHADTAVRVGRKLYTGSNLDVYNLHRHLDNMREPPGAKSDASASLAEPIHSPWQNGETEESRYQEQHPGQAVAHSGIGGYKPATDYQVDTIAAAKVQEPTTPQHSHFAQASGGEMLRMRASVSGGNVRAMAAMFESMAKEKQEGPSPPVQPTGGGEALMTEYFTNATPPRTSRSLKSLETGNVTWFLGLHSGSMTDGGASGLDKATLEEHDAQATRMTKEQRQRTRVLKQNENVDPGLAIPAAASVAGTSVAWGAKTHGTDVTAKISTPEDTLMPKCLRKSRSQSGGGGGPQRSRSRSPGTCLLHAQIRSLKMQLATKVDECGRLRTELLTNSEAAATAAHDADSAAASLSSQLRWARQEVKVWRERAEAEEQRSAAHGRCMQNPISVLCAPLHDQHLPRAVDNKSQATSERIGLGEAGQRSPQNLEIRHEWAPVNSPRPVGPRPLASAKALTVDQSHRQLEKRGATVLLRGDDQGGGTNDCHFNLSPEWEDSAQETKNGIHSRRCRSPTNLVAYSRKENACDSASGARNQTTLHNGKSISENSHDDKKDACAHKITQWSERERRRFSKG